MSKIWIVAKIGDVGYDEYDGLVVTGENSAEVKKFVNESHYTGLSGQEFTVTAVGTYNRSFKRPRVLLESFNAG